MAAVAVQRTSPHEWKNFLEALTSYTNRVRDEAIKCDPAFVLVAQGRARSITELWEMLNNAPRLAEKIEKGQS